jgi:hypothetical protein
MSRGVSVALSALRISSFKLPTKSCMLGNSRIEVFSNFKSQIPNPKISNLKFLRFDEPDKPVMLVYMRVASSFTYSDIRFNSGAIALDLLATICRCTSEPYDGKGAVLSRKQERKHGL